MILYPDTVNAQISQASSDESKQAAKSGIITKKDVTKSFWIYYFGCELSNSYERLQSLVFCASMIPTLKKLYPAKEDLADALKRHLAFFNTEGSLGGIIQGMSGSPIVQDGKIVGAVTHVVTSSPDQGYGVFVEWMLQHTRSS